MPNVHSGSGTFNNNKTVSDTMTPLQPDEVKRKLTQILEAIIRFCDENGICYFLAWGTLLGAVRHKGFIPWDDDVDIWIPRPDYNRFVQEFHHGTYVFRSMEKEDDWPLCFGKVCDANYIVQDEFGHDYGLYVDIFPLDGLPEDERHSRKHIAKVRKKERLWSSQVLTRKLPLSKEFPLSKNLRIVLARALHLFYSDKKVIRQLSAEYQRYSWDNASDVVDFSTTEVFEKNDFIPAKDGSFEGLTCKIPFDEDAILHALYGEYMTIPPEGERYNHGITVVIKKHSNESIDS